MNAENGLEQEKLHALEQVKQGAAVIAVNDQAVAGLLFEDVLRLIRISDYPVTIVFGQYIQGKRLFATFHLAIMLNSLGTKNSTLLPLSEQSPEYFDSDALAFATGVRFVETYNNCTRECIREGDREAFRARVQAGISLDLLDDQGNLSCPCCS